MREAEDIEYWQRRERQSLDAAASCEDPHVASVHRQFADTYRDKIEGRSHQPHTV